MWSIALTLLYSWLVLERQPLSQGRKQQETSVKPRLPWESGLMGSGECALLAASGSSDRAPEHGRRTKTTTARWRSWRSDGVHQEFQTSTPRGILTRTSYIHMTLQYATKRESRSLSCKGGVSWLAGKHKTHTFFLMGLDMFGNSHIPWKITALPDASDPA